jgi:uncharacterized membrane protein YphA (DoxX/SURF4 family)
MKRTTIIESIVFLYTILFLYTAISKLTELRAFRETLVSSPILSPIATLVAWGLPWVEFAITLMLIIPRWRLKGLQASLVLMILFTGYIIGLFLIDKEMPCSCGGIIQQLSWKQHLIFNGIFILLAIWGALLQKREKKAHRSGWGLNDLTMPGYKKHSV